jgi:hypothetical protein
MNRYKEPRGERRWQKFVSRDLAFHWTVSVPGSSRASVIHSVAAVALAIAILGVAGVSRATDRDAIKRIDRVIHHHDQFLSPLCLSQ